MESKYLIEMITVIYPNCVISFRILFGLQIELTLDLNEMKANALIMDLLYLNIIGAGIYFPGDFFLNFLKK